MAEKKCGKFLERFESGFRRVSERIDKKNIISK